MNVIVDKFGRLVLPKVIRDNLGLEAGSELKIEEAAEKIILTVVHHDSHPLQMEEGVLVFTGRAIGNIEEAITRVRDERINTLKGSF